MDGLFWPLSKGIYHGDVTQRKGFSSVFSLSIRLLVELTTHRTSSFQICLAQEAQQRPYSIPPLVPAVATHPVVVRNETIMRNPVYYFTVHNLSPEQRKLVTKAIYATMTVSRRTTLKTCSVSCDSIFFCSILTDLLTSLFQNLCCDLSIYKEVALPPAEDYFESPYPSKDPLCLHCVWCASLVQA